MAHGRGLDPRSHPVLERRSQQQRGEAYDQRRGDRYEPPSRWYPTQEIRRSPSGKSCSKALISHSGANQIRPYDMEIAVCHVRSFVLVLVLCFVAILIGAPALAAGDDERAIEAVVRNFERATEQFEFSRADSMPRARCPVD
jgi:hypothetical protein